MWDFGRERNQVAVGGQQFFSEGAVGLASG
jgi:hypothetical protein